MAYDTAGKTDAESVMDDEYGGMWFLKDQLDTEELGFTVLELEPGAQGKEHDHGDAGQEEVYYVVDGVVDVEVGGETVTLESEEAIRIDSGEPRQIHNRGNVPTKLVLAGAPL